MKLGAKLLAERPPAWTWSGKSCACSIIATGTAGNRRLYEGLTGRLSGEALAVCQIDLEAT